MLKTKQTIHNGIYILEYPVKFVCAECGGDLEFRYKDEGYLVYCPRGHEGFERRQEMDYVEIAKMLREHPIDSDDIQFRVGARTSDKKRGIGLAYADLRAYLDALDAITDGNWTDDQTQIFEMDGGVYARCPIMIDGVVKVGFSEVHSGNNAVTAAVAQAFKRALVKHGLWRDLYSFPDVWVELKNGKYITKQGKQKLQAALRSFLAGNKIDGGSPDELDDEVKLGDLEVSHYNKTIAALKKSLENAGYDSSGARGKFVSGVFNVDDVKALTLGDISLIEGFCQKVADGADKEAQLKMLKAAASG
jgi:hypothetical protein